MCCTCYWRREIRVAPVHVFFTFFFKYGIEWFEFTVYAVWNGIAEPRSSEWRALQSRMTFFFSFLPPCSLWSGQVGYRVFLVWLECTVYCTHSHCLTGFVIGPHVVAEYVARFNETRPVIVYAVWDPQPTSWFALRLTWDLTASRLVVRAWYALKMRFHITFYTTVEQ